jgi:hypothetical protein
MQMSFDQAVQLIELLIIVIAMILIYRSVPTTQVQKLFDALERAAKQSATPLDDQAVSAGRLLATLLTGQVSQTPMTTSTPAPAMAATPGHAPAVPSSDAPTEFDVG